MFLSPFWQYPAAIRRISVAHLRSHWIHIEILIPFLVMLYEDLCYLKNDLLLFLTPKGFIYLQTTFSLTHYGNPQSDLPGQCYVVANPMSQEHCKPLILVRGWTRAGIYVVIVPKALDFPLSESLDLQVPESNCWLTLKKFPFARGAKCTASEEAETRI